MLAISLRLRPQTEEQEGEALQENPNVQMQEKDTAYWYSLAKQSGGAVYLYFDSKSIFLRIVGHFQECIPEANYSWYG